MWKKSWNHPKTRTSYHWINYWDVLEWVQWILKKVWRWKEWLPNSCFDCLTKTRSPRSMLCVERSDPKWSKWWIIDLRLWPWNEVAIKPVEVVSSQWHYFCLNIRRKCGASDHSWMRCTVLGALQYLINQLKGNETKLVVRMQNRLPHLRRNITIVYKVQIETCRHLSLSSRSSHFQVMMSSSQISAIKR